MSYEMWKPNKPQMYEYGKVEGRPNYQKYEADENPPYWTWAMRSVWERRDCCIKFINDTGVPVKIHKLGIKSMSCNSGGQTYWSSSGVVGPCDGYGGDYYAYIRVLQPDGSYLQSDVINDKNFVHIPNTTTCNMVSRGSSTTNTGYFKGEKLNTYDIPSCPVINPDQIAYIHFGIDRFNEGSTYGNTTIRFILNPEEMEVQFDTGINPYIWVMCSDGKWHLRQPLYVMKSDENNDKTWTSAEEMNT